MPLRKKERQKRRTEKVSVRGVPITRELLIFIEFLVHTFVRPTESEVFALRHRDLRLRAEPRSLQVFIEKPKTKNSSFWSEYRLWLGSLSRLRALPRP